MSDVVGDLNCWFSHAHANLFILFFLSQITQAYRRFIDHYLPCAVYRTMHVILASLTFPRQGSTVIKLQTKINTYVWHAPITHLLLLTMHLAPPICHFSV